MTIATRKLFGSTGASLQAEAAAAETTGPDYGAWYAQQMARSYAASRSAGTVVPMFPEAPCRPLSLAA